jgi:hypothetical protein
MNRTSLRLRQSTFEQTPLDSNLIFLPPRHTSGETLKVLRKHRLKLDSEAKPTSWLMDSTLFEVERKSEAAMRTRQSRA